jgi:hypothetical protein
VSGVPALVGILALLANGIPYLLAGGAAAATGPLAYLIARRVSQESRGGDSPGLQTPPRRPI